MERQRRIYYLRLAIQKQKSRLEGLWNLKGRTDQEVLKQAENIDRLLNLYDRLIRKGDIQKFLM